MGLDILIILAALGFSAYAGFAKKKREAQKSRRVETAEPEIDPWSELKQKIESVKNPSVGTKGHQTVVIDQDSDLDSPWYYEKRTETQPEASPQTRQEKRKKVANQSTKRAGSNQGTTVSDDSNIAQDDVMDRFNLHDAVIFSEILRPKFREDNI